MRSLSTLQEAVIPIMSHVLPKLVEILMMVARNPSKPHFNHYLFESLSLCIRIMCTNNPQFVSQFEASLFPIIQGVLQQDVIGKEEFKNEICYLVILFCCLDVSLLTTRWICSICRVYTVHVPNPFSAVGFSCQLHPGSIHDTLPLSVGPCSLGETSQHSSFSATVASLH